MRRALILALLCLLAAMTTGCKRVRVVAQTVRLMRSTVTLPEKITGVHGGETFPMPDSLRNKTKFIVFVDSTDCSKCRISRFVRYGDMFRLSAETQAFVPILLLSAAKAEQQEIIEHLQQIELPFPVYLDMDHAFAHDNPLMLSHPRFYAVTVDGTGKVLLPLDPVGNKRLMKLFRREIIDKPKISTF